MRLYRVPFHHLAGRHFVLWLEREQLGATLFVGDWRYGRPFGVCFRLRGRYADSGRKLGFGRA